MKRSIHVLVLSLILVSALTAASPLPKTTFTLVQGLPSSMTVGDIQTVVIEVSSDQQFLFAQALPSFQYVAKGVVAVQGGDHAGRGYIARLEITFKAKSSTAKMEKGMAPVHVVVGVRHPGGYVAVQDYLFNVRVP